jgi:hypothetical protein
MSCGQSDAASGRKREKFERQVAAFCPALPKSHVIDDRNLSKCVFRRPLLAMPRRATASRGGFWSINCAPRRLNGRKCAQLAHIMDRALPLNLPRPPCLLLLLAAAAQNVLSVKFHRASLPCAQNQLPRVYLVGLAGRRAAAQTAHICLCCAHAADDDGERILLSGALAYRSAVSTSD